MLSLLLCVMLAGPLGPRSEEQAFRLAGVEPIVAPSDFRAFLVDLQLGPDERDAAELLLDDYAMGMRSVLTDLQATQASDRERLDAALSGKMRINADTLRAIRISLQTVVADACKMADGRLAEMVEWAVLLSPANTATIADATGRFERRVFLVGGNREGLVDVAALAAAAQEEDLIRVDAAAIGTALRTYDPSIAHLARVDAMHVRDTGLQDGIAALRGEQDARRSLQASLGHRWVTRMQLQDAAIAAVAKVLDPESAAAWRVWADAAFFPSVCSPLDAVQAQRWVQRSGDVSAAATGAACIEASMSRLRSLRDEAVVILREGRGLGIDLDHDAASLVEPAYELRMRYLRNSGERSVLEQDMLDCVLRPLTDGQRAAVRRVLMTGG